VTKLDELLGALREIRPDFVTVTYGAMGSSRPKTIALIEELVGMGFHVVAHLACLGNTRDELVDLIHRYEAIGACGILALRGDPPLEGGVQLGPGDLRYAGELVDLVRQESDLPVMVALHPNGHPESVDLAQDRAYAAAKLARADLGLTQFFFDYPSFAGLRAAMEAHNVATPVVPGLMVPASPKQLQRMAQIAGIKLSVGVPPLELRDAGGLDEFRARWLDAALALAKRALQDGAKGVHLFSMNNAAVTTEFFERLSATVVD
jgi:methylenetetrahydrofolate reductase (NADPH)